jgi:hypothetical protein
MTITAQSIIKAVAVDDLQDPTSIKWTIPSLARMFNRVQRITVVFRPDACVTAASFTCAAGSMQTLPSGARLLINVLRNTAGNKGAVTMPKNCRALLDSQIRGWRSLAGVTDIQHAMYDERDPLRFEVYPPATTSASLEIVYGRMPTDISIPADGTTYADVTGNLDLLDSFASAMEEGIKFLCYAKDANFAGQSGRASAHLTNYANLLGVDIKSVMQFMARSDDISGSPATGT